MSRKSIILFALLAVIPLSALGWLGWRVARMDELRLEQRYRAIVSDRLRSENEKIASYFSRSKRQLAKELDTRGDDPAELRELVRTNPTLRQVIVLDRQGDLIHPRSGAARSQSEQEFLNEIADLLLDRDIVRQAFGSLGVNSSNAQSNAVVDNRSLSRVRRMPISDATQSGATSASLPPTQLTAAAAEEGWYVWYYGRGVHLLYWRRRGTDRVTVACLARARWMADILALLPDSNQGTTDNPWSTQLYRIALVDSSDRTIYQWGELPDELCLEPLESLSCAQPLSSWRFKYFIHHAALINVSRWPMIAALVGTGAGFLALVIILSREYAREVHEAQQRVSFVNQVTHELKTPLTNIRMYAELLEMDRQPDNAMPPDQSSSRLRVIIDESQRLTRLINNVLTFARGQRRTIQLHKQLIQVDELVQEVVERFRPCLEAEQLHINLDLHAGCEIQADRDAVDQILGNLISNVERYAREGAFLGVTTERRGIDVHIRVQDHGPGVPRPLQQRLFDPFVRGSEGLSDATGTGIGLTISRQLAELHGGMLRLIPSDQGACFELTLPVTQGSIDDVLRGAGR